jgi:hypothetical protein
MGSVDRDAAVEPGCYLIIETYQKPEKDFRFAQLSRS